MLINWLFGRTRSLERLNRALRETGLEPQGFPEALRLALLRLVKDAQGLPQRGEPAGPAEQALAQALEGAARLFALCYFGPRDYVERNEDLAQQEARLAVATEAPEGLDARIISLALLSGYAHDSIAARFEAVVEEGKEAGA